jgi:hypothetical protein
VCLGAPKLSAKTVTLLGMHTSLCSACRTTRALGSRIPALLRAELLRAIGGRLIRLRRNPCLLLASVALALLAVVDGVIRHHFATGTATLIQLMLFGYLSLRRQ